MLNKIASRGVKFCSTFLMISFPIPSQSGAFSLAQFFMMALISTSDIFSSSISRLPRPPVSTSGIGRSASSTLYNLSKYSIHSSAFIPAALVWLFSPRLYSRNSRALTTPGRDLWFTQPFRQLGSPVNYWSPIRRQYAGFLPSGFPGTQGVSPSTGYVYVGWDLL